MNNEPRYCAICGKEFIPKSIVNIYCGTHCADIAHNRSRKKYYYNKEKPRTQQKKPRMTLDEKVIAAEREGVSYGYYVYLHRGQ